MYIACPQILFTLCSLEPSLPQQFGADQELEDRKATMASNWSEASSNPESFMAYLFAEPVAPAPRPASHAEGSQRSKVLRPAHSYEQHLAFAAEQQLGDNRNSKRSKAASSFQPEPRNNAQTSGPAQPNSNSPKTGIKRRRSSVKLHDIPEYQPGVLNNQNQANGSRPQARPLPNTMTGLRPPHGPANNGIVEFGSALDIMYPFLIDIVVSLPGQELSRPFTFATLWKDSLGPYAHFHEKSAGHRMWIMQLKLSAKWEDFIRALDGLFVTKKRNTVPQSANLCSISSITCYVMWNGVEGIAGHSRLGKCNEVELRKALDMIRLRGFKDHFCLGVQPLG